MDPLSATASVIAVLQLSSEVIKYINSATGATKERKRLREELRACETILQQLKDEADDSEEGKAWSETIKVLEAPGAPLGRLWVSLRKIKDKLQPKEGLRKALACLEWPFNEKEIKEIYMTIEREKSLLDLALANNSRKLIQEIMRTSKSQFLGLRNDMINIQSSQASLYDGIDELHQRQDNRDLLEERLTILDWLAPTDYALQQSDFIHRRQAGTCQWLLDSEEYQAWLNAKGKTLFCPGIPGVGKTILTSIVVDDIRTRFYKEPTIGLAYIYFNFRRQSEQNVNSIVANLLKQLAEHQSSLPTGVTALYDKHKNNRIQPSFEEILRTFQSTIAMYTRVMIVVDAIDECQASEGCRRRLLSELFSIQTRYRINLFVTSRFIPEIVNRFKGTATLEIRASNEDVERYIEGHLEELPSFVQKNRHLQEEIKTGISKAVDGM
jgi:hypothetical protein